MPSMPRSTVWREFDCEALVTREQLALLERFERLRRRIPAVEHPLINSVARQATPEELGGKLSHAIAEATLISRAEAPARQGGRRSGPAPRADRRAVGAGAGRHRRRPTRRDARHRAGRGDPRFCHQLPGWIDAADPRAGRSRPGHARAPGIDPNSWPSWPPRSPTASIPTAATPTRTARGGAG